MSNLGVDNHWVSQNDERFITFILSFLAEILSESYKRNLNGKH